MRTTIVILTIFTMIFTLVITDAAAKEEVYRWVDENGVVHFESQPPPKTDAEQITIPSDRSSDIQPWVDPFPGDSDEETEPQVSSYAQQKRDERAKKREEADEKEKLTTAACEQSRKVVAQLEPMTRVLVEQEDGTVIRMDDNDRLERLREEKAYIAENCKK